MYDSGEPIEVSHQLYGLIFRARKASLISLGTRLLQFSLRWDIRLSHYRLAEVEKWLEAEDYSELKNQQQKYEKKYEKFVTDPGKVESINISWISDRDALLHLMKQFTTERTELEDIAAMTDFTEQAEAFADYYAKERIKEIRHDLEWIALGGILGPQDIQRIIKTVYLDRAGECELEELAQIFGRHDLIEICESVTSRMYRMVRDDKRRKLLRVLRHRIAHKDT